jgi:hypothetical protein
MQVDVIIFYKLEDLAIHRLWSMVDSANTRHKIFIKGTALANST